jgi:hypothetical protein
MFRWHHVLENWAAEKNWLRWDKEYILHMSLKESSRKLPIDILAISGQMATLVTEQILIEQTYDLCNIWRSNLCGSRILWGCYLARFSTLSIRILTRGGYISL